MAVTSFALSLDRMQGENVAWKLLRAQNAPYIIAILNEHLAGGTPKRSVAEMVALVDADIEMLSEQIPQMPLTKDAKSYLDDWRNAGYLVRKPVPGSRQETYELSSGALAAIGFAKSLEENRRTATKSRLGIIFGQISSLALDTSLDEGERMEALIREKQRVEDEIEAMGHGRIATVDDAEALERAREVIALAQEIPRDFAQVSDDFERINKSLYDKLVFQDGGQKELLEGIFAGVDYISQSPSGQSFKGFFNMLRDIEESERLQDDIDSILEAGFSREMSPQERRFLRRLVPAFMDQGREVNATRTDLARGLRRFVQTQGYLDDRKLRVSIDSALGKASALAESVNPSKRVGVDMELTSVPLSSISRLVLDDPADSTAAAITESPDVHETPALTLEQLKEEIRKEEIDFGELISNVNCAVTRAASENREKVSVGEVLEEFPATQGVASVIGLMLLAGNQGVHDSARRETVRWTTEGGRRKKADVELFAFNEEVV